MKHNLIEDKGILAVYPDQALAEEDFQSLTAVADAYLASHTKLRGLMIVTENFPGWEDASGFLSHIKFVRDHHKQIEKVAIVSNSSILGALPTIAKHFVAAEIKEFDDESAAMAWFE